MKNNHQMSALLREGRQQLEEAGIGEAALDAWLLLEYVTGITRAQYFARPDQILVSEQVQKYQELLRERAKRIPLQHLTHQAFFMGYEFYVDNRVLIPRQDTEILVEEALKLLKNQKNPRILDMCTGSGCILLSLLLMQEGSTGIGIDASADALSVAEKNRNRLGLLERAQLLQSDLFEVLDSAKNSGKAPGSYDMLVSNPPYIPTAEIEQLMEEVRLHDPRMALDGSADGLWFYREITGRAADYLTEDGWLIYEIGYDQGTEVAALLNAEGYRNVSVKKDLTGLPRVVMGQRPIIGGSNV